MVSRGNGGGARYAQAARRTDATGERRRCPGAWLTVPALAVALLASNALAAGEEEASPPDLELLMFLGTWDDEDAGWLELMHEVEPPGTGEDDEQE